MQIFEEKSIVALLRMTNTQKFPNYIYIGKSYGEITADGNCNHEIKRCLLLGWKAMTNLDSILKKQRRYFAYKSVLYASPSSQSYGFSSSHVWMSVRVQP